MAPSSITNQGFSMISGHFGVGKLACNFMLTVLGDGAFLLFLQELDTRLVVPKPIRVLLIKREPTKDVRYCKRSRS
jgi:hypothetical protein